MDAKHLRAAIAPAELRALQDRLTAYGEVCFTASEARRMLSALGYLYERLDQQAALTQEVLRYMDRALRAECLLRRTLPTLQQDVSPETAVLLEEVGHLLGTS